jgi:RsiW-degrading membrane proteinase PrsW (M82 family)
MTLNILYTVGAIALGTGVWLWMLRLYDRVEPESVWDLAQVGLIGGGVSLAVAVFLNELGRQQIGITGDILGGPAAVKPLQLLLFSMFVGFNEEIVKAVSTVQVTRVLGDLNEPIDAMIYAMTVGLGFAAIENVLYVARFGTDVLVMRLMWPVLAHMAYSAVWGYGLAKARFVRPETSTAYVMAPTVFLASLVHAVANFLLFLQGTQTALISLGFLAILSYFAHDHLNELEAESPFLLPGECPVCRHRNNPRATTCSNCGESLQESEIFRTCPCGLTRIPTRMNQCAVCGVDLSAEEAV